jgi:hypothetical protein
MSKWLWVFFPIFFLGLGGCTKPTVQVEKIDVIEIDYPLEPGQIYPAFRVNRPYFDWRNQLRWNNLRLTPGRCKSSFSFPCWHEVLLLNPRVDLCGCPDGKQTWKKLFGLDEIEEIIWQRELKHRPIGEYVIGSTQKSIVLNTLEVIDPKTGTVLEPAIMRSVGFPKKTVSNVTKYSFSSPAVFRIKTTDFIFFKAEYSLLTSKGGLSLFNPKTEVKELLKKSKKYVFKHLRVDAIALSEDERFAFLAQLWTSRGSGDDVEFVVFDLEKKQTVFKERLENDCYRRGNSTVVVGKHGHVAMSYGTHNKHIVVHYVISQ